MKDEVIPKSKWEFNNEVAECFDDMLERSIPDYQTMRDLTNSIGKRYVKHKTTVVDLGCSNGNAINEYIKTFGACNSFKLYDVSDPMLEICRKRFAGLMDVGVVDVQKFDITKGLMFRDASLVLSILTLQFTPIEYRQKIVNEVYNNLLPEGAFILVEKVLGDSYELDELLVDEYYNKKKENGYTQEQIASKRKSLEGVLVPITSKWNEELLKGAGFTKIDCFWRYLNFSGWIAIK